MVNGTEFSAHRRSCEEGRWVELTLVHSGAVVRKENGWN
jgi:hypothetical protein